MVTTCEHGKVITGSIKSKGFLYQLRNFQLLKKNFCPIESLIMHHVTRVIEKPIPDLHVRTVHSL